MWVYNGMPEMACRSVIIIALVKIVKLQDQLRCLSEDNQTMKIWHLYTMNFYSKEIGINGTYMEINERGYYGFKQKS